MDAVVNMQTGKRLIRASWSKAQYVTILASQNYIWQIGVNGGINPPVAAYTPSLDDIYATDWTVMI
jgi:hypothetical protein